MEITLKIEKKRIRVGDLRRAQRQDMEAISNLIAACMVNPDGSFMDRDQALAILDEVDMQTLEAEIVPGLFAALEVAKEAVLPLANGRR